MQTVPQLKCGLCRNQYCSLGGAASHPTKALNCTLLHSRSSAHHRLHLLKSHGHRLWKNSRCGSQTSPSWTLSGPRLFLDVGPHQYYIQGSQTISPVGIWCPAKCAWLAAKHTVSCAHTDGLQQEQWLSIVLEKQCFLLCLIFQSRN